MNFANGDIYIGTFVNGIRDGYVTSWYYAGPNCTYTGQITSSKRLGRGKMIYHETGDIYEGDWINDKRQGHAKYYSARNNIFEENTQWNNDLRIINIPTTSVEQEQKEEKEDHDDNKPIEIYQSKEPIETAGTNELSHNIKLEKTVTVTTSICVIN